MPQVGQVSAHGRTHRPVVDPDEVNRGYPHRFVHYHRGQRAPQHRSQVDVVVGHRVDHETVHRCPVHHPGVDVRTGSGGHQQ
jgi:hypothetical protein